MRPNKTCKTRTSKNKADPIMLTSINSTLGQRLVFLGGGGGGQWLGGGGEPFTGCGMTHTYISGRIVMIGLDKELGMSRVRGSVDTEQSKRY